MRQCSLNGGFNDLTSYYGVSLFSGGKDTAYLIYRKKLFGHFFINSQGTIGAIAPATKKYMSATEQSASIQIRERQRHFTANLNDQCSPMGVGINRNTYWYI